MSDKEKDVLKQFELLIAVNLKEVSKYLSLKDVISRSSIFPREEKHLTDSLLDYIANNQEKVLLVFDGYDEYRCGRNSEIYEIFRRDQLRNCCVLITTRISKADELREFKDVHAEITGFSEMDRQAFMKRMLGSEEEATRLMQHLSNKNLKDLARVPLLLLFFCTLWKRGRLKNFPETTTKLYLFIVQYVLDFNQGKDSPVRFGKVEDFKEILAEIGKVALECLLKDDHLFEYDQLSPTILSDESRIIGLLQVTEYAENLRPAGMVSFIHKSIQEFLAAWYITYRCVPEGNLVGIEQQARTLEDCKALENVFQFICGLSDDGAVKVFQHFTLVRILDPSLDLSKIIPDTENDDVSDRHIRFTRWVSDCFQEVQSKAELLSHRLDCLAGVVLVNETEIRFFSELIQIMKHSPVHFPVVFYFRELKKEISTMFELLDCFDCLRVPLRITEKSATFSVGHFLMVFMTTSYNDYCNFNCILRFRNGEIQFYITDLFLCCDDHARLFTESLDNSVPSGAANMCSEQSCLKFLKSLQCSYIVNTQTFKDLGAVIKNCKHLKSIVFERCGDGLCEVLEQLPNPSACSLRIGSFSAARYISPCFCRLTSAGAERLAGVLPRLNNMTSLYLRLVDCCNVAVNKLVCSITHKTLKELRLSHITLTPAAAAALGQALPEMSSLQHLDLVGVTGSILQVEEIEALFGGFNKTFPSLKQLVLHSFNSRGSLAPLTERLQFFPNLEELSLGNLNMDEHDLHGLLESLRSSPNVRELCLRDNPLCDRDRVESILKQALPQFHLAYW